MNAFLNRGSLAIMVLALSSVAATNATAQDSHRQKPEQPQQQSQYRDQTESLRQDTQQRGTQSLAGQISQKHGKFYLEQEFHGSIFELTDAWEAKRYLGKKVRITGVLLDSDKNILRVIAITIIPGPQSRPAQQPACPAKPCS